VAPLEVQAKGGETFGQRSKGDKSVVLFGNLGNSLGTPKLKIK